LGSNQLPVSFQKETPGSSAALENVRNQQLLAGLDLEGIEVDLADFMDATVHGDGPGSSIF
jgi:hypothetical protein